MREISRETRFIKRERVVSRAGACRRRKGKLWRTQRVSEEEEEEEENLGISPWRKSSLLAWLARVRFAPTASVSAREEEEEEDNTWTGSRRVAFTERGRRRDGRERDGK